MTDTTSTEERAMSGTDDRLREALLAHHPIMRSETGPLSGCRCGAVGLGQDVIAHVAAELRAYGDLRAAEELRAAANGVDGAGVGIVGLPGAVKQALGIAAGVIRDRVAALTAREETGL